MEEKERPVLLNSWEAAYFDINEKKLLKLAKAGKEAGIELFVMDDGWFGERKDDKRSLGDWEADKRSCRTVSGDWRTRSTRSDFPLVSGWSLRW